MRSHALRELMKVFHGCFYKCASVCLTQPYIEHVLHCLSGLCIQDAASHAQPHDGALADQTADQDAEVTATVIHQRDRAWLLWTVWQPKENHGQNHEPAERAQSQHRMNIHISEIWHLWHDVRENVGQNVAVWAISYHISNFPQKNS